MAASDPDLVLAAWFYLAAEQELSEIRASLRSGVYERLAFDRVSLYRAVRRKRWTPTAWQNRFLLSCTKQRNL